MKSTEEYAELAQQSIKTAATLGTHSAGLVLIGQSVLSVAFALLSIASELREIRKEFTLSSLRGD